MRPFKVKGGVCSGTVQNAGCALAICGGDIYVWGESFDHDAPDVHAPRRLAGPAEAQAPFVSAGLNKNFAVAIDSRGAVWWWGEDSDMFHLDGLTWTLTRIPTLQHAVQVAVGHEHGLVLVATGAVYGLGNNDFNQAAPLPVTDSKVHEPTLVAGLDGISVSTVHAGDGTSFAVSGTGELFSWGAGFSGGLATGTLKDRRTGPARVEAMRSVRSFGGSTGLVAIATNAETGNEEFYTWGYTCAYISADQPEYLLEPRRIQLGLA